MGEFGYRLVRIQSEEKSENLCWAANVKVLDW